MQQYLNPEAKYWLDWFHFTMRITVMKQAKGLAKEQDTGIEWRPGRDVPSLVPAVPVRATAATEGKLR
jgi:hypothetical protein